MIRRLTKGAVVSVAVLLLPVLGNAAFLREPGIWILLAVGVLASVLQPDYNPFSMTDKARDRGTGAQIIWSIYVTQLAAVLEAAYLRYPESVRWDPFATTALVLIAVGLSIRTWAVLTLGDLFTIHIAIRKDHSIVRSGPYAFVRHPSYLGAFILFVSTALLLHAWFSAVAAAGVLALAFARRIRREEEVLGEEFGEAYESYRSEVAAIIPGVW
ncbi:MAG: methyltransferase family protein [Planctomycetota bacterium]|jgi:protein-S-isoprenylcysteine O-methyltransferase Ste14